MKKYSLYQVSFEQVSGRSSNPVWIVASSLREAINQAELLDGRTVVHVETSFHENLILSKEIVC